MHPAAPSGPVDQALQAHTFEVEPVKTENFPVPHGVHNADPGSGLKVPDTQRVQASAPSDPVDLALHAHTLEVEPATAENFPAPHSVHAAAPGSGL